MNAAGDRSRCIFDHEPDGGGMRYTLEITDAEGRSIYERTSDSPIPAPRKGGVVSVPGISGGLMVAEVYHIYGDHLTTTLVW